MEEKEIPEDEILDEGWDEDDYWESDIWDDEDLEIDDE